MRSLLDASVAKGFASLDRSQAGKEMLVRIVAMLTKLLMRFDTIPGPRERSRPSDAIRARARRTEAITASGPCHKRKTYVPRSPYRSGLPRFSVHLLLKPLFTPRPPG
jgi:hypothetical protein